MIAATLALALFARAASVQESLQLAEAKIAVTGPIESVRVVEGRCETTLLGPIADGERFEVLAPVLVGSLAGDPRIEIVGGGPSSSARFAGWNAEFASAAQSWWDSLSPGLRARPRPSLPGFDPQSLGRAPITALLVLGASLALAAALRRRAAVCIASSAACSAAIVAITLADRPRATHVGVFEGDGTSGQWIYVECSPNSASFEPRRPLRVALEPPDAGVSIEQGILGNQERSGWISAPRARIWKWEPSGAGGKQLEREGNSWDDLAESWVRDDAGVWRAHGTWKVGAALPPALEGASDPPGWLNPALPMGSSILIARLPERAPNLERWVRVVGF